MSARTIVQKGPAMCSVRSSTLSPSSGPRASPPTTPPLLSGRRPKPYRWSRIPGCPLTLISATHERRRGLGEERAVADPEVLGVEALVGDGPLPGAERPSLDKVVAESIVPPTGQGRALTELPH